VVKSDFPKGVGRPTEEEAKAATHDVPDEPSEVVRREWERQVDDEREHGHPAMKKEDSG
jgi:hypothetical protein